jgi:hypothetical protein
VFAGERHGGPRFLAWIRLPDHSPRMLPFPSRNCKGLNIMQSAIPAEMIGSAVQLAVYFVTLLGVVLGFALTARG